MILGSEVYEITAKKFTHKKTWRKINKGEASNWIMNWLQHYQCNYSNADICKNIQWVTSVHNYTNADICKNTQWVTSRQNLAINKCF